MNKPPPIVGITGGIGAGKSTVCKIFEVLGAQCYYADDRAKWLMENDDQLVKEIKDLFGIEAYNAGKLNRPLIAKAAFEDPSLLDKLNNVVHPAVARDVLRWREQHAESPLLIKEAALLFETGSYQALDHTILVTAPEEIRIQRVLARDAHRSREDVKKIISNQMPDTEKEKRADFVVINDGHHSLIEQVMKVYNQLIVA